MQYFVQAKVFEAQANYYGAIVALRNAADLDPTSPTIYARLAWDYHEINDNHMAAVFARKALEIDPKLPELRYLLFQLLSLNGDQGVFNFVDNAVGTRFRIRVFVSAEGA